MTFYPLVSIVIPTHNRKNKLVKLINSIKNSNYPQEKIEVIVIDDASTDNTREVVNELFPDIILLHNSIEKLPSTCRNLGIKNSSADYLLLVDDDNILDENTLKDLISILTSHNQIGLVGPVSYYDQEREKIWCAGGKINAPLFVTTHVFQNHRFDDLHGTKIIEVDYVPNAFMVKKEIFTDLQFFDTDLPLGWEEIDLALRIRKKGYKVIVNTTAKVFHDVSFAQDVHITEKRAYWRGRNRTIFFRKHSPIRCCFLFLDIIGFLFLLVKLKGNLKYFSQYIKGVGNGLVTELSKISCLSFQVYN